jgi:hypothetical protein
MKTLQVTCVLIALGLGATFGCGSDDEDPKGGGGSGGSTGGSGGTTGGSGGTTGGTGGSTGGTAGVSTGGVSGGGGTAGAAGGTGCPPAGGDCYACGQLPGQDNSTDCAIGPPQLCGWAVPGNDAGIPPTKSAEKFFALIDCVCEPSNCGTTECAQLCGSNEQPDAVCLACFKSKCGTENDACNNDTGS